MNWTLKYNTRFCVKRNIKDISPKANTKASTLYTTHNLRDCSKLKPHSLPSACNISYEAILVSWPSQYGCGNGYSILLLYCELWVNWFLKDGFDYWRRVYTSLSEQLHRKSYCVLLLYGKINSSNTWQYLTLFTTQERLNRFRLKLVGFFFTLCRYFNRSCTTWVNRRAQLVSDKQLKADLLLANHKLN